MLSGAASQSGAAASNVTLIAGNAITQSQAITTGALVVKTLNNAGANITLANASNAVALVPSSFASAWAYREDYKTFEGVSLKGMMAASALGGLTGAVLLVSTPETTFDGLGTRGAKSAPAAG